MAERVRSSFTLTLPGSQSRAIWALVLFVAVQFADAIQTVIGISAVRAGASKRTRSSRSAAAVFGASTALVVAKTVAIIGGATLHVFSQHFILAALTVACVFGAIVPWAHGSELVARQSHSFLCSANLQVCRGLPFADQALRQA